MCSAQLIVHPSFQILMDFNKTLSEGAGDHSAEASSIDEAPAPHTVKPAQHAHSPTAHVHRTLKGPRSISKRAIRQRANGCKAAMQSRLLAGSRAARGSKQAAAKLSPAKSGHQLEPAEGAAGPSSQGAQLPSSEAPALDGM